MDFKIFNVKAYLLCLIFILTEAPINGFAEKGNLPSLRQVFQYLQSFMHPTLRNATPILRTVNNKSVENNLKVIKDASIEKAIKDKIAELKPLLQDKDTKIIKVDGDIINVSLEGNDETTIIEIVEDKKKNKVHLRNKKKVEKESNQLRDKIGKYKIMRRKIKAALKKENVTTKTLHLVTNALDEMMVTMIENRCVLKETQHDVFTSQRREDRSTSLAHEWSSHLSELKENFTKFSKTYTKKFPGMKILAFLEQFHDFLTHVDKDLQQLPNEYKMVCEITRQKGANTNNKNHIEPIIRKKTNQVTRKPKCEDFKICSDELYQFMTNLFIMLNDTAVSTLTNYGSMYIRDVNTDDSQEKENVVSTIDSISKSAKYKIIKIFKRETAKFELNDKKDERANIKALKGYIRNAIESTKIHVKDSLDIGLKSLTARLLRGVKEDLSVNLDVDLSNLERDLKNRICTDFSFCNGKFAGRRRAYDKGGSHVFDNNSVYVKLQLTLDDEMKEFMANPRANVLGYENKKADTGLNEVEQDKGEVHFTHMYRKFKPNIDSNEYGTFNVTRTTLIGSTRADITTNQENINTNGTSTAAVSTTNISLNSTIVN